MATGLKDSGEELLIKRCFRDDQITMPTSVTLHLFDDNTDAIADSGDFASITTQPASTGSATYSPQTASLDTASVSTSFVSSNWQIDIADQAFDTSSLAASDTVRDYAISASVQLMGDGAATRHLLWTGDLDQAYDLSNIDTFTLQNAGLSLD